MHRVERNRRIHAHAIILGVSLVACDPAKLGTIDIDIEASSSTGNDDGDDTATTSGSGGSPSGTVTSGADTDPSGDGQQTLTSGDDTNPTTSTGNDTDDTAADPTGGVHGPCDVFAQDCPEGEKCMPWANDYHGIGSQQWNEFGCSNLDPGPDDLGSECFVEGSIASGIDSCDLGAMCWDVDPDTNQGTCTELCTGTADEPTCATPGTSCVLAGDFIPLCLVLCDPLLQDCGEGLTCAPLGAYNFLVDIAAVFACMPDVPQQGALGDNCEYPLDVCDPGLVCASDVTDCNYGGNCCTPFCDLGQPDTCPGVTTCTDYPGGRGILDPEFEHLGICM